jgi:hypothetical protein
MRLLYLLFTSIVAQQVDNNDYLSALKYADEDPYIGWSSEFTPQKVCFVDDHPYTIRIEYSKGETLKNLNCMRPWRTMSWFCEEVNEDCTNIDFTST